MKTQKLTRRAFNKKALATTFGSMILSQRTWSQPNRVSPNDRINIGMIGLGGMGIGHVDRFLHGKGTQIVAVCDLYDQHYRDKEPGKGPLYGREPAKQKVEGFYSEQRTSGTYKGCDTYSDFRELCTRKDIDAVVIATPDHWHAFCSLEAIRNGKDVYCEKPVTHLFSEGQHLVKAIRKHKAIFQTGSQQRSNQHFRHCVELVRNGVIGNLKHVEIGLPQGLNIPRVSGDVTEPPENIFYDQWCGPSEKLPYTPARHHRWWRFHRAYGGGIIMDWIGHHNDIAHWGMGVEKSGPVEVDATNTWVWPEYSGYNTPVDYDIRCQYANGITSSISSKNAMGVKWIGDEGWIHVSRSERFSSNPDWMKSDFDTGSQKVYTSNNHVENFLEGIRTRKECVAPADIALRSITPGLLGYVSQNLNRKLKWDSKKESFKNDREANRLLKSSSYRSPWQLG